MTCPRCSATLVQHERSGVVIDSCPNCRGIWLDGGELEHLVEREQSYYRERDERRDRRRDDDGGDDDNGGGFLQNILDLIGGGD